MKAGVDISNTEDPVLAVKTASFEGPLDLLLQLIERRKMHVSEVSLAAVADDFVNAMRGAKDLGSGKIAHFILVASTLMLIKSQALLPALEFVAEEEKDIDDLKRRLEAYRRFQEIARMLHGRFGHNLIFAGGGVLRLGTPVFAPSRDLSFSNIKDSLAALLTSLPKVEAIPATIIKKVISLEETMVQLAIRIQAALKFTFREFIQDKKDRVSVVVSFLGLLELVKRGVIDVIQDKHFSEISIETRDVSVPRY